MDKIRELWQELCEHNNEVTALLTIMNKYLTAQPESEVTTDTDRMEWWKATSIWWMEACQEAWKQRDDAWARIRHLEADTAQLESDNQIAKRKSDEYIKYHYSRYSHYNPNLGEFRKWLDKDGE